MNPPCPPRGEFDLIAWARRRTAVGGRTTLGIGDDCASLRFTPGREVLITTDMLMDGRHFRLAEVSGREIGYKALAVNLSDIAAMAGEAVAAVAAVALPKSGGDPGRLFEEIYEGMAGLAKACGVDLVGGDTNAWDGPLVISVTAFGESARPVRRSGARPGDAILVTGPLGGSLLGRHLRPVPRLSEALALADAASLHAMIDLSDGLSSDLPHILDESGGLGARLDAEAIPIHDDAFAASRLDGRSPLDHALNDGEDFELCLTLAPDDADRLLREPPPGVRLWRIGEITAELGVRLCWSDGSEMVLEPRGFDHLAPEGGS